VPETAALRLTWADLPLSDQNKIYESADGSMPRRVRKELAAILAKDGVVVLPTETVYGLAARADSAAALERLRELKGRPADLPLTWHVGSQAALASAALPNTVARLAKAYWPGPLTLVVKDEDERLDLIAKDGWYGVRLPAHTGTSEFLDSLRFPVVMTSVNKSGEAPLCTPAEILAAFGDRIDYLVDNGPSRIGEASTVLRVGPGSFEVLREGLLALPELRRCAGLRIAFTCTGNTCRSPLAEGLTKLSLSDALGVPVGRLGEFGFEVGSMGVFAPPGAPAAEHGITIMEERGYDLSEHCARVATEELVAGYDLVYGLTESHVDALRGLLPARQRRRVQLLDPEGYSVPDPIGGSLAQYEECAQVIEESIERRMREWV